MKELFSNSLFFGVGISLLGYEIGLFLKKKWKLAIFNPLLVSILFVMLVLIIFKIDYESYSEGTKYLSYLLTPATICLAIPLYEQIELLKHNKKAILLGIISGVLTNLISIFVLCLLFNFTHKQYVTLLPKSITTAIGIGISNELGGMVTITVASIILTGVLGNIIAEGVLKIFRITHPIAKGVAIGTASHAVGTAKALEIGEIEGAMSSLSIAVTGILTVIGASLFMNLI